MKLYLTKEEINDIEDCEFYYDNYVSVSDEMFQYPLNTMIFKANRLGYPFSISIDKTYVVEAMYNGGVLIRPYDSNVDYALENIK